MNRFKRLAVALAGVVTFAAPMATAVVTETHVAEAASCTWIENRAAVPGVATFTCSGSGIVTLNIKCYYYDGGPYTYWRSTVGSPGRWNLRCGSSRPFLKYAFVTYQPSSFAGNIDRSVIERFAPQQLSSCHANHGATIVLAWCDSGMGLMRAHARCSDGSHHDGGYVYRAGVISEARCGIFRVTYYGYHLYPPNPTLRGESRGSLVEHHLNDGTEMMGTVLPGQFFPTVGWPGARPDLEPNLATGCYISPSTGHYAKGTCPGYSGSGSRGFHIEGYAWNGCNKYILVYGTSGVAGVRSSYIPGPGPGYFLPFPWTLVSTWTVKTKP